MAQPATDRRIIITGAAGFVGGHLIAELAAAGYPREALHAVTLSGATKPTEVGATHACDLRDARALNRLLVEVQPTGIVHLAAVALPAQARQDPAAAWAVNFDSVRLLSQAILSHVPGCTFVFAGSSESYGDTFNRTDGPVDETLPLRPMTAYAATKAAADVMLGQMRYDGLNVARFRAFNHTGPGQSQDYVVAAFAHQIAQIAAGRQAPVIHVGNLDAERDFLDVRDVVRAYRLALEVSLDPASDAVFNLASGEPRSIRSILDTLIALAGVAVTVETDLAKLRKNDVPRTWGTATRAAQDLGWMPRVAFDETLRDTLARASTLLE